MKTHSTLQFYHQTYRKLKLYLLEGWRQKTLLKRLKRVVGLCCNPVNLFTKLKKNYSGYYTPNSEGILRLLKVTKGLHSLLPFDSKFSYSILMPVYKPFPRYFKTALESVLQQTAPVMEVLVGFDGPQPEEVYQVVKELNHTHPGKIRSFEIDRQTEGGGISATTNYLAKKAIGHYLLLVDHDDWVRPDLLYRYEQTLRLLDEADETVLYCNEYKIDENDVPIVLSGIKKTEYPVFPYLFVNYVCHCLLVPKSLWEKAQGLRSECDGSQDYDLVLRLDLIGAHFQNVPFFLYAWRSHSESTAHSYVHKHYVIEAGVRSLSDYAKAKGLNWSVEPGTIPTTYRAIPYLTLTPKIHAIMLYKDQKELTLKAVKSLIEQTGVEILITAVDNNSLDLSIADELRMMNVEVLTISEPFNYSRLNNLAVERSSIGTNDELLLFINNDVELKPHALLEMSRWIHQPKIGVVGCRLHYPNGLLQHGGVELNLEGSRAQMHWEHTEKMVSFDSLSSSLVLRVVDAVTAACALMKKDVFIEIGGFDEIWYPIAFSDTNLSLKLKNKGWISFYTPYAEGIHYESVSRSLGNIEDFEQSTWLNDKYKEKILSRR